MTHKPSPRSVPSVGHPAPLGATWDGTGTNFALYSSVAEQVELCVFDAQGQHLLAQYTLQAQQHCTDNIWHIYLPDCPPGTLYAYRVLGPYRLKRRPGWPSTGPTRMPRRRPGGCWWRLVGGCASRCR